MIYQYNIKTDITLGWFYILEYYQMDQPPYVTMIGENRYELVKYVIEHNLDCPDNPFYHKRRYDLCEILQCTA